MKLEKSDAGSFTKCVKGDQNKEPETDGACSMHGTQMLHTLSLKLKARDLGVNGIIS
jgi:hypothetical protein